MNTPSRRRGFTLIELLVVVAIIVALLALLMPAINRAIAVSQAAVCLSNQRQTGNILLDYAADTFGLFPPSDQVIGGAQTSWAWRLFIKGYIATPDAMACPTSVNMDGVELGGRLGDWDESKSPTAGDNINQKWVFGMRQGTTGNNSFRESFGVRKAPSASDTFVLTEVLSNAGTVHADFYIADYWHLVFLKHFDRASTWYLDGSAHATEADYFENHVDWGPARGDTALYGWTTTERDYK